MKHVLVLTGLLVGIGFAHPLRAQEQLPNPPDHVVCTQAYTDPYDQAACCGQAAGYCYWIEGGRDGCMASFGCATVAAKGPLQSPMTKAQKDTVLRYQIQRWLQELPLLTIYEGLKRSDMLRPVGGAAQ